MNKTSTQLLGYHLFSWMCLIEVHRDTCGQYFALCTADMVDLSRISYQYPIYCSSFDTTFIARHVGSSTKDTS